LHFTIANHITKIRKLNAWREEKRKMRRRRRGSREAEGGGGESGGGNYKFLSDFRNI
jgi:hypothetical protein